MADIRAQLNRARDAANDMAETASVKLRDTTEKAKEGATDLIQASRDRASDARDRASAAYDDARDRTQKIATRANEIVQEHPIAAVAGAVAAGAVIAWMFPKSRAAMKALPALVSTAGARIAEAAVAARDSAAEGAQHLKSSAGGALHGAGESVKDTAASVRSSAKSADIAGNASRLADEVVTLVSDKIDAFGEALKARLPKR